jgi:hypothetical protein
VLVFFVFFMESAMVMKPGFRAALFGACALLSMASASVLADEVPLVTGEMWSKSSGELKKAYLIGVANTLQVEVAYEGANPPPDSQSLIPRTAKGLKGQSLDSVTAALDKWYAANPGKLQRPVLETIWFEIIVPGLQKYK